MQRNILIGNGINIEFGGGDNYSNHAILERLFRNMKAGKYEVIFPWMSKEEQISGFEKLHDVLIHPDNYKQYEYYYFKQIEIERVKKQYSEDTSMSDIGMEDYFLALEWGIKPDDSDILVQNAHRELQMPIIDAIYNDGLINEIDYCEGFRSYLSSFDNVFTINYDSNLDQLVPNVYHLHGEFSKLAPMYNRQSSYSLNYPEKCRADEIVDGFLHVYSNTIMSWYWLEKFGNWLGQEDMYGSEVFKNIEGKLEIIGMSPCNDEHLFIMINQSNIRSVDYYFHSDEDRERMQHRINKPTTYKNVDNFWNKLSR